MRLSSIQSAPYLGGIVLVAALIALLTSIHAVARPAEKVRTGMALVFTGVFAGLIFFNYVAQTTFLPELARGDEASLAPIIATLSMANPRSRRLRARRARDSAAIAARVEREFVRKSASSRLPPPASARNLG